ncbi:MAG: autotransporter outer membrane beta-barrel domain-containing protein, partial [Gammaproteobacteria bacterium]|nr:autotransporter outer membrane beta-barrel domain-containing protein [Gammaproteobacteria bacterium]
TTGSSHEVDQWKMQFGIDGLAYANDDGKWIIGLTGNYGTASADITSVIGNGSISTAAGGVGITTTWYDNSGFYFDGQTRFSLFSSDLDDVTSGSLVEDNRGRGYSFGLETGKRIETGTAWTFTPQAQLVYSRIDFDNFTGPNGEVVSLNDGDSLRGRIGISFDQENSWKAEDGTTSRSHFYGIVNLHHEFLDGTEAAVSVTSLANEQDQWSGEIGLGSSWNWGDDKYSLYSEASVS